MSMRLVLVRPLYKPMPTQSTIAAKAFVISPEHGVKLFSARSACGRQSKGDSVRDPTQSMEIDGLEELLITLATTFRPPAGATSTLWRDTVHVATRCSISVSCYAYQCHIYSFEQGKNG